MALVILLCVYICIHMPCTFCGWIFIFVYIYIYIGLLSKKGKMFTYKHKENVKLVNCLKWSQCKKYPSNTTTIYTMRFVEN